MSIQEHILNAVIRLLFRITCRIDTKEFSKIPRKGPGILVTNHTTFFEAPLYYVFLSPRKMTALAKKELWRHRLLGWILDTWGVISVSRGEGDVQAMRASIRMLSEGGFLGIAPEGTRSRSGSLIPAQTGATYLASREKVPVYPIAQWGLREFGRNLKRLRRTDVSIRVGKPFFVGKKDGSRVTGEDLRKMTDEIMYQIAVLLPERFRGVYSDLSRMTTEYITYTSS